MEDKSDSMEDKSDNTSDTPVFQFQNSGLSNRCKDVFSGLDALEQKHREFEKSRSREDADTDKDLIDQAPSVEGDSGCSSTFKRPTFSGRDYHGSTKGGRHSHEKVDKSNDRQKHNQPFRKPMPPNYVRGRNSSRGRYGRGRGTPDYKLHPERWTEYSLEDVDTSDTSNKAAALDFLHERRKMRESSMKEEGMDLEVSACSKGQITFKKPSKAKSDESGRSKSQSHGMLAAKSTSEENMESDYVDDNETKEYGVGNVLDSTCHSQEGTSLKRKFENIEIHDEVKTGSDDAEPVSFKNRKSVKRNFRFRKAQDDDSND